MSNRNNYKPSHPTTNKKTKHTCSLPRPSSTPSWCTCPYLILISILFGVINVIIKVFITIWFISLAAIFPLVYILPYR
ncbi:hypothetical protein BC829DRAFT_398648 [Chytridium lagenaria]|nr:hypothetical protein BC829DRAFT_398648 [Chytridium lagenaria]